MAAGAIAACDRAPAPGHEGESAALAAYVGGASCVGCHSTEAALWRGSHHDLAMQIADETTVLGDFGDAEFAYAGVTSLFFRRDGRFWVRTDGPDGVLADFEIEYTFGVSPLQQYLIALPGGRYQALGIAWDARAIEEGGGRWFHLYPDAQVTADDPRHWTRPAQNWNGGCAECHSTDLDKGYSVAEDIFATRWSDIDVNCEACHGPGSLHVADPITAPLALDHVERVWAFGESSPIATRIGTSATDAEIETCAQCHARRAQHDEEFRPAATDYLDSFQPALLDADLYHPDGQIRDEVYEYGSFLQSAMYAAGVTCSDCHDPHSGAPRAEGNALCSQCHLPATFDDRSHHRHDADSAGAQCVDCHMTASTYMVVDPRRDHSFRVPRPDLSVRLDTPNACTACHTDRDADWAAATVAEWFPQGAHTRAHYGDALAAGQRWTADRGDSLRELVADAALPAIVRATAVRLLGDQLDDTTLDLIAERLSDASPLVQVAAVETLVGAPPAFALASQRFLTADSRALRIAVARTLAPARANLSERRLVDLDRALEEYRDAQAFNMDRASGHFNWGTTSAALGRNDEAEQSLRTAIGREPAFSPAYVNLADLIRRGGREQEALDLLRAAFANEPNDPTLIFALGLSLVRMNQSEAALESLARAAELAPQTPRFAYTLGVALYSSTDPARGLEQLRQTHERFPGHTETLLALATMSRDRDEIEAARDYARKLAALLPRDPAVQSLLRELDGQP